MEYRIAPLTNKAWKVFEFYARLSVVATAHQYDEVSKKHDSKEAMVRELIDKLEQLIIHLKSLIGE